MYKRTTEPSIFRTPKAMVSTNQHLTHCPRCSTPLEANSAHIPLGNDSAAIVPGAWCRKCDKLYVESHPELRALLKDNVYAKEYTLDGEPLWNFTVRKKQRRQAEKKRKRIRQRFEARLKKLAESPSAEMMICVHFEDRSTSDYVIVSRREDCNSVDIVHYASDTGRELLSAAFAEERKHYGILYGKAYRVINCVYPHPKQKGLPEQFLPVMLEIRPDGGYISSIVNARRELADTLLYSLQTNRYEIIRTTYDKFTGICSVDIGLFRSYVKQYGRPGFFPDFPRASTWEARNFSELNSESILKGYGYSVSRAAGMSVLERRELLAEIVDLELLTVSSVVRLLDFFIQTHSRSIYAEACCKWQADKAYIQQYRVDPERFLIVHH